MQHVRFSGRACRLAAAAGVAALGLAGSAHADMAASIECRGVIGKGLSKLIRTGYKLSNKCHRTEDHLQKSTQDCNDVTKTAFDPGGKYNVTKTRTAANLAMTCKAGDPVLGNYDGGDVTGATYPDIDGTIGGNSTLVLGTANLNGDAAKERCVETIAMTRTGIIKEILKGAIKCQTAKDKLATMPSDLGALDPSCNVGATKFGPIAQTLIAAACPAGTLDQGEAGSCGTPANPLPGCAIDSTVAAAQQLAKEIYQKITPPPTQVCQNGIVEGTEQCDDGNNIDGDGCNHLCESEANTCGPGTSAGGTITGHRLVTVHITTPSPLAGLGVSFDYPQLEASIPGFANSSVVKGAVSGYPSGPGIFTSVNDTDADFSFAAASANDFIATGTSTLLVAKLNECVPVSLNLCNRNPNVTGCCPDANIDACNTDFLTNDFAHYYDDCHCGAPISGVRLADCTTNYKLKAELGNCTVGACASPPSTITCGHGCTAGGSDKLNHACTTNANCFDAGACDTGSHLCTAGGSDKINQACSADGDCFDAGACDVGGTNLCTAGEPSKIGTACGADTDCDSAAGVCDLGTDLCTAGEPTKIGTACAVNTDCDSAAGLCSSGNICTAGDATRIGLACSIANDCGTPLTVATCEACPQLGDRNNGTFGCADIFNGPVCKPGHFPAAATGGCDGTASGPIGGCPLGNTCERQDEITTLSCTVSSPVDHTQNPVDGVSCTIDVTEAP